MEESQPQEEATQAPTDPLGRELQKWIQCCKCERWRKVPFSISEDQIPDDWVCRDNVWDPQHNSCDVEQELSDDKIDAILQLQEGQEMAQAQAQADAGFSVPPRPEFAVSYDDPGYEDDDYDDGIRKGRRGRWGRGRGRSRGKGMRPRARREESGGRGSGRRIQGSKLAQDEAAAALIGMGEEGGFGGKISAERYYPGRLVWAKVEGHDWWPGKIVRRRAVPREVVLPPGGPTAARFQIPVVFFTPNGIPGETSRSTVSKLKTVEDALEALKPGLPDSSQDEEAEYAWLVADALKPFKNGDKSGSPDSIPTDELLVQSIEAANRAAAEDERHLQEHGPPNIDSDSDGGWGPQSNASSMPLRGRRGRGGRGRKGRGSKRGRGRGRWSKYEEEDVSDEDYEPGQSAPVPSLDQYGGPGQKIVV